MILDQQSLKTKDIVYAFTLNSEELPIRTFTIWNAKKTCLQFFDSPDQILLMMNREKLKEATDLELSDFVASM